mgnify:CR=1 FL=1
MRSCMPVERWKGKRERHSSTSCDAGSVPRASATTAESTTVPAGMLPLGPSTLRLSTGASPKKRMWWRLIVQMKVSCANDVSN